MLKLKCKFLRSRNSCLEVLKNLDISFSQKMLFCVILGYEGAFVAAGKKFCCFDVLLKQDER